MKKFAFVFCLMPLFALQAVEISAVTARQRWPWNNLVDIDFTVDAPAGEIYRAVIDAKSASGGKVFSASTFVSDPAVKSGANRIVWDFGADYPNVRVEDLKVTVSLAPYSEALPLYLKIDLSGGPDAAKYPVTYTFTGPAHVQGASGEPCQTTELWLRRIRHYEGAMPFHRFSYTDSSADNFFGELTKDYYIGVFELTQRQYELVTGDNPSFFSNKTCYASRPVERINGKCLFGSNINIHTRPGSISKDSFFGKIRARTGLPLAVPSSMQFEYALRGGYYTGEYYRYKLRGEDGNLYVPSSLNIGRWKDNSEGSPDGDSDTSGGTAAVGSYLANMFGLYDTMGNVYEITCEHVANWDYRGMSYDLEALREAAGDATLGKTKGNPVVDYFGKDDINSCWRTMGGSYAKSSQLTIWNEGWYMEQLLEPGPSVVGVRVSMNVE